MKLKRELQEENTKLAKLLCSILYNENCAFWQWRKWQGGTCAEENGRGFSCHICAAEEYLESVGLIIDGVMKLKVNRL